MPRTGAFRKLVPGISAAVILYGFFLPALIPWRTAIGQLNCPAEELQEQ